MTDAVERLVNLAITIASAPSPITASQLRDRVAGYPPGQDDAAFQRMFERDKEALRAAGLVFAVDRSGEVESYRLDEGATFAPRVELSAEDATVIRAAGAAMLSDPSFPRAADLRLALAKLSAAAENAPVPLTGPAPVLALTADEDPESQATLAATLMDAVRARKTTAFRHGPAPSVRRSRRVDPYGLFARDGRWYLVGRDHDADAIRVFALVRMTDVGVESRRPGEHDFEPPPGFDVSAWMLHPFQFGGTRFEARLRFTGVAAWRAHVLAAGQGTLCDEPDGSVTWRVPAADAGSLARWAIAQGPGVAIEAPEESRRVTADGLARVVDAHAR